MNSAVGRRGPDRSSIASFQLTPFYRLLCGAMVAVRGIPSGMPASLISGPRTCAQLPPHRVAAMSGSST
ncbi:hypothetical protein JET67_04785 [Pseudomonas palleroniana]|nr:hypothetical protein [Pseudomonas palleroniana]